MASLEAFFYKIVSYFVYLTELFLFSKFSLFLSRLLEETPPNGPDFASSVRALLRREQQWNAWKNEGCPKFNRAAEAKERIRAKEEK